jgi:uroporphyrinogen decarboxylase
MTSKERITIAMKCGVPDRVPVTMGLSEMVPVKYFGGDYIDFFIKNPVPLWKARVETEYDRFHSDSFMHLEPKPSLHDPEVTRKIIRETSDEIYYSLTYNTAAGALSGEYHISRNSPPAIVTPFVRDPEADMLKVLGLLKHPDSKDLSEIKTAYASIGERAHVGFWLSTPIDWWSSLRGTENTVMDLMLLPELMSNLFKAYTEYSVSLINYVLSNTTLDSVGLGGSTTSMSVISPDLHRRFSLEFGKAVCASVRKFKIPVQYHMCGKSRQALPITEEMGVDGFDALECPPTGNVNLAEVKRIFGGRISLRGNVNSIHVMLNGTPEDVKNAVKACMDAAKAGGGYILGVGDQTPMDTPEENLYAFVEAGLKYGKY